MHNLNNLDLFEDLGIGVEAVIDVPSIDRALHVSTTRMAPLPSGRRGRLNIENRILLSRSGLVTGVHVRPVVGIDFVYVQRVEKPGADTIQVAAKRFSNRDGSFTEGARVDIRRNQLVDIFPEDETLLVAYCAGGVLVTLLPTRKRAKQRWVHLLNAVKSGVISTSTLYAGIGTLDSAIHEGLARSGLHARSLWVNEYMEWAAEASLLDNPAAPAMALSCGIEQVLALQEKKTLPAPTMLVLSPPCKGASKLNIRDRDEPERHPTAGHQVLNIAMLLQTLHFAPPLLLIENVTAWADTVSCPMLRKVLEEQGYETMLIGESDAEGRYSGLLGSDFGDFERRRRMALLAYPPELRKHLDFSRMVKAPNTRTVAQIRDSESSIDPDEYERGGTSMARKAENNRPNRVVSDNDTTTPVISSEAWKIRPEDAKFPHPSIPGKWRLPTPEEHARLKGHPESLIRSLETKTAAHTALGNGTTRRVWVELARTLGASLISAASNN